MNFDNLINRSTDLVDFIGVIKNQEDRLLGNALSFDYLRTIDNALGYGIISGRTALEAAAENRVKYCLNHRAHTSYVFSTVLDIERIIIAKCNYLQVLDNAFTSLDYNNIPDDIINPPNSLVEHWIGSPSLFKAWNERYREYTQVDLRKNKNDNIEDIIGYNKMIFNLFAYLAYSNYKINIMRF
jgi:hypothetical protein